MTYIGITIIILLILVLFATCELFCKIQDLIFEIMAKRQTPKQELDWQADSDARTLAEYQAIMNDKERLKRATVRAEKLSEEYAQQAAMLNKSITGIKKKK